MRNGGRRRTYLLAGVLATLAAGAAAAGFLVWTVGRSGDDRLRAAAAAYQRGEWKSSSQLARDRLKVDHDDRGALALLARSLLRQGEPASALSLYDRLGDAGLEAEDYYLLGMEHWRRKNLAHAIDGWERGLARNPRHAEMLSAFSRGLLERDQFRRALDAAVTLKAQPGWSARASLLLGEIHNAMNAPVEAAAELAEGLSDRAAAASEPELRGDSFLLARNLLRTGRPSEARAVLARLRDPAGQSDREVCWMLSRCDLQEGKTTDPAILEAALSYRDEHPLAHEPAPYVGAARCAPCHRSEFEHQQHSRHNRTLCRGDETLKIPFPEKPVVDPGDPRVVHSYRREDQRVQAETRVEDRLVRMVVDYAFGSGDRGLTPVGHDEKGRWFESRLSYYPQTGGWDVTSGHPEKPGHDIFYQGNVIDPDMVRRCILCHHTNPESILGKAGPETADAAIGCERCHGPGGNHLLAAARESVSRDPAVARPALAPGEPILRLCGQCHDPHKVEFEVTPALDTAVRFQPTSLRWSQCYLASDDQLDCITCHNPHRDAETSDSYYEAICLRCHGDSSVPPLRPANVLNPRRDRRVAGPACPVNPAAGCIGCHMPRTHTAIPHTSFTDHFIRVRRDAAPAPPGARPAGS